ncbi:MAG: DUF1028 domain-containing protein [Candidatus Bathyarchaeota archaeon]|nr:DUF1028 domain-containing protein [Candidatus Bathyarchaeota archaeon]MDW8040670.1 DUF1028 domain-containing protein [Nitrososphaerota archaeon]
MSSQDLWLKTARLVPTYSIVAYDFETGELGVAVQSRYFSVGSVVPWAEAGVGAIATQSFVNLSYGPKGLELLKKGLTAKEVVEKLVGEDGGRDYRQLGIVDASGNAASYTGSKCLEWAGGKTGRGYAVQGNILVGENVTKAMAEAYESARGSLAERLMVALDAGENAGGDARGRQSAALLVVKKNAGRGGYGDRFIDLRVEDHHDPVNELKRLLRLHRVYYLIDEAEAKFTRGALEEAIIDVNEALKLKPDCDDAYLDLGLIYLRAQKFEEALRAFKKAVEINQKIASVIRQIPKLGIVEVPKGFFDALLL